MTTEKIRTNLDAQTMPLHVAAERIGVGRGLAYELARRGEFPGAVRLGGRILVRRQVLEDWLAGRLDDC